jgi:hypothetical protein
VFFLDLNLDADITVLPGCASNDRPAKHSPKIGAEYWKVRLDATREFRRDM